MNRQSDSELAHKEYFARLVFSRFVSGVGDWGGLIAVSQITVTLSSSIGHLALIYALKIVALTLASPLQKQLFKQSRPHWRIGPVLACLEFFSGLSLILILKASPLSLWVLGALYFFSALTSALFTSLSQSLITTLYPSAFKDRLRLLIYSKNAAFIVGPILMGLVISHFGVNIGIIADAFSFFASALFLFSFPHSFQALFKTTIEGAEDEESANQGAKHGEKQEEKNELKPNKTSRPYYAGPLVLILTALIGLVGGGTNAIELPFILRNLHLGADFFGISLAIGGCGSLLGVAAEKAMAHRFSELSTLLCSLGGLIVSFLFWYPSTPLLLGMGLFLFGFFVTLFSNYSLFMLIETFEESPSFRRHFQNRPRLFLIFHQIDSIAMIAGALFSGFLADNYSLVTSLNFILGLLIFSILLIILALVPSRAR